VLVPGGDLDDCPSPCAPSRDAANVIPRSDRPERHAHRSTNRRPLLKASATAVSLSDPSPILRAGRERSLVRWGSAPRPHRFDEWSADHSKSLIRSATEERSMNAPSARCLSPPAFAASRRCAESKNAKVTLVTCTSCRTFPQEHQGVSSNTAGRLLPAHASKIPPSSTSTVLRGTAVSHNDGD